jgi:hypothetical protein
MCRSGHPHPLDAHDILFDQAVFGDYAMTYYAMKLRMLYSPLAITECRSQSKLNPPGLVIFRVLECLYLGRVLLVLLCESPLHIRAWRVIPLEENLTSKVVE